MIVLAIIAFIILTILLAPIGLRVKYSDVFMLWISFAGINIKLIPGKNKQKDNKKNKTKTDKKVKNDNKQKLNFEDILLLIKTGVQAVKDIIKSLRIKRFRLAIIVSGEDAAVAAINYGRACAAASAIYPVFEQSLNKNDTDISVDLEYDGKTRADADIIIKAMTIRLLAAVFKVLFAVLPMLTKKNKKNKKTKKGGVCDERSK